MFTMIFAFLFVFSVFFFGLSSLKRLPGTDKVNLLKLVAYSVVCAALTLAVLVWIVITF